MMSTWTDDKEQELFEAQETIARLREFIVRRPGISAELSALKECQQNNEALREASEALLDAVHKHTVLGRGDWLNGLEANMKEAIRKASQ